MIKAREINKFYGSGESRFQVLKNISLTIEDGDFVVILGASGSGKSTLLNVLSGLERAESGQIFYDDTEITGLTDKELTAFRRKKIGFIFQQYYLLQNMNVGKNVKMGADLAVNSDYKAVLKEVGLENKLYKFPSELSGGEQQRVAIARAIVNKPKVLIADEPTGNLDSQNSHEILSIFKKMNENHITIIMVSHDPLIASYSSRLLYLKDGKIEKELFKGDKTQQEYFKEIVSINSKEMQKMLD